MNEGLEILLALAAFVVPLLVARWLLGRRKVGGDNGFRRGDARRSNGEEP